MGCDIHAYVEYKYKGSKHWMSFGGRINPGRIYGMFAKLADVRNGWAIVPISEPRGVPQDMAGNTFEDYSMYISDTEGDRYVTADKAAKWVENGSSVYLRDGKFVSDPDWHSHSWCTTSELEIAVKETWKENVNDCKTEWDVLVDIMKSFERHGNKVRLVFWFDN